MAVLALGAARVRGASQVARHAAGGARASWPARRDASLHAAPPRRSPAAVHKPISMPACMMRLSREAAFRKGLRAAAATAKRRNAKPKGSYDRPTSLTTTCGGGQ